MKWLLSMAMNQDMNTCKTLSRENAFLSDLTGVVSGLYKQDGEYERAASVAS